MPTLRFDANTPASGEDSNDNGVGDAYDGKISTDQINKDYIGEDEAPLCSTTNRASVRKAAKARLAALADRVSSFEGLSSRFESWVKGEAQYARRATLRIRQAL